MANHFIYVPGLGDHHAYGQNILIQFWRLLGLRPHYLPLGWNKQEGFDTKLRRLTEKIVLLQHKGNTVSLVGVSAGASAVLNAYANSQNVATVICISGKINHPETISQRTFAANPDFKESVSRLSNSLSLLSRKDRNNIMSIHPWRDQTVPIADTKINGAREKTVPGWNHASGIFFAITLGAASIARFIRFRAR